MKLALRKTELSKMGTGNTITFDEVQLFLEELLTYLQGITSDYGNGKMGHTHLFYTTAEYNKRSVDANGNVMPYMKQPYPGTDLELPDCVVQPVPVIDARPSLWTFFCTSFSTTEATRQLATTEAARQLKIKTERWQTNYDVVNDTKAMIQQCTSEQYYASIKDAENTYFTVSVLDFIQHFVQRYGRIDNNVLNANDIRAAEPIDLAKPIHEYIQRINKCRYVAAAGQDPISDRKTIRLVLNAMAASMQFTDDLRTRSIDAQNHPNDNDDDDWPAFQVWLYRVDDIRRTYTEASYHEQANRAAAVNVIPDKRASSTQQKLNAFYALQAAQSKANQVDSSRKSQSAEKYCHTHGICFHSSKKCKNKGPDHRNDATLKRKLGGPSTCWKTNPNRKRRKKTITVKKERGTASAHNYFRPPHLPSTSIAITGTGGSEYYIASSLPYPIKIQASPSIAVQKPS